MTDIHSPLIELKKQTTTRAGCTALAWAFGTYELAFFFNYASLRATPVLDEPNEQRYDRNIKEKKVPSLTLRFYRRNGRRHIKQQQQ